MKAWQLLDKKARWTKHTLARTKQGNAIKPGSSKACSWCLMGAIRRCYPSVKKRREVEMRIMAYIEKNHPLRCYTLPELVIAHFNDLPWVTFTRIRRMLRELDI